MYRLITLFGALALAVSATAGNTFDKALVASGYVHVPVKPDTSKSLEAEAANKTILDRNVLHSSENTGSWRTYGDCEMVYASDSVPVFTVNIDTKGRRAIGSPDDPDYALYGHAVAVLELNDIELTDYNRLEIDIEPLCPGMRAVSMNLSFSNSKGATGQGYNTPTGAHLIILDNFKVNRTFLEIADFRRDAMSSISLSFSINGADLPDYNQAKFRILRIEAQKISQTEKISGWQPEYGHIIHSMSGYAIGGRKTALASAGKGFRIRNNNTGKIVFKGTVKPISTSIGNFGEADFSALNTPGEYRIECDSSVSTPFRIDSDASLWQPSAWKVLNFIYGQRCGCSVPGVHSTCHFDLMSEHNGLRRSYAGGWHDAGDLSQQTLQTADVTFSLLELYEKKRKSTPLLASRLREEAFWGIEFMLRNRFGDGFHASSVGLLIWQDGILGSHDDIFTVRVQNVAYDNYLYAAYEAYASMVLDDVDPVFAAHLARCAEEDYGFAEKIFDEKGFGGWINPYEHTFCTGESLHMATASWAASMLHELTGKDSYAADARRYADYVLACQQTEPLGDSGLAGFFYRNQSKRSVVHFIHQSREQIYMLALDALCRTQAEHSDMSRWKNSMALYGNYIKKLMCYTAPYGMIPAGIYRDDEPDDREAFFALHLFPPSDAGERFTAQAALGTEVAPGYFVKRFPVWFNIFNGNLAVHMSMGKAAAICASRLNDAELLDIAREQLYWTVGKNPFGQSLIYGEGYRYPELKNFSSGRLLGAMPVGIRTLGDSDEPYWPQINNACYKEVWLTSAGKWLSLLAETDNTNIKS